MKWPSTAYVATTSPCSNSLRTLTLPNGSDAAKLAAGNVIGSCAFHAVPRHMVKTVREQGSVSSPNADADKSSATFESTKAPSAAHL